MCDSLCLQLERPEQHFPDRPQTASQGCANANQTGHGKCSPSVIDAYVCTMSMIITFTFHVIYIELQYC